MTQNPYAQFGQAGGEFLDPIKTRTSVMAVISLVMGIISIIPIICCVPGPGAVAVIFGGLAVFFISRSAGQLTGMGLAVTGIVMGLLASLAAIAFWVGASQMNSTAAKEFFIPLSNSMKALESDPKSARTMLTPKANEAISDEMLADFVKNYQAELGTFKNAPQDVIETIRLAISLKDVNARAQSNGQLRPGETVAPIPMQFEKGPALVAIHMDPGVSKVEHKDKSLLAPIVVNIGVLTPAGKEIWLLDPNKVRDLLSIPGQPATPDAGDKAGDGATTDAPKAPDAPAAPKP